MQGTGYILWGGSYQRGKCPSPTSHDANLAFFRHYTRCVPSTPVCDDWSVKLYIFTLRAVTIASQDELLHNWVFIIGIHDDRQSISFART